MSAIIPKTNTKINLGSIDKPLPFCYNINIMGDIFDFSTGRRISSEQAISKGDIREIYDDEQPERHLKLVGSVIDYQNPELSFKKPNHNLRKIVGGLAVVGSMYGIVIGVNTVFGQHNNSNPTNGVECDVSQTPVVVDDRFDTVESINTQAFPSLPLNFSVHEASQYSQVYRSAKALSTLPLISDVSQYAQRVSDISQIQIGDLVYPVSSCVTKVE